MFATQGEAYILPSTHIHCTQQAASFKRGLWHTTYDVRDVRDDKRQATNDKLYSPASTTRTNGAKKWSTQVNTGSTKQPAHSFARFVYLEQHSPTARSTLFFYSLTLLLPFLLTLPPSLPSPRRHSSALLLLIPTVVVVRRSSSSLLAQYCPSKSTVVSVPNHARVSWTTTRTYLSSH